jgi:hypothetical protein
MRQSELLEVTLLQVLAFLAVPVGVLFAAEAFFGQTLLRPILTTLPVVSDTLSLAASYGLSSPSPVPIMAAAVGGGTFLISRRAYAAAVVSSCRLTTYLRILLFHLSLVLGSSVTVFFFAALYLRLRFPLSIFLSLVTGFLVFRVLLSRGRFRELQA